MSPIGVDNPYRTPGSAASPQAPGRRLLWKLYSWLIALAYALVFLAEGVRWMQALDVVDTGATAVGLAGLFAYAYRRRLASTAFWKGWLPLQVGWDLLVLLQLEPLGLMYQFAETDPSSAVADTIIGILLLLPLYFALFRYAFRSPEIWQD